MNKKKEEPLSKEALKSLEEILKYARKKALRRSTTPIKKKKI